VKRVILCDFDGTVTTADITNTLCCLHIPERWAEVEDLWLRGEISATECYELEYEALGFRRQEIDAYLETVKICAGTQRLLQVARDQGWKLHVLSAGFDYYIERVLGRHGISVPYTANRLRFSSEDKPIFEFLGNHDPGCIRYKHPCAGCKPAVWRLWKEKGYRIAYVGDGSTDFCMADCFMAEAKPEDLLFAKERLLQYCRERSIPAIPYATLDDVAASLEQLTEIEGAEPSADLACSPEVP